MEQREARSHVNDCNNWASGGRRISKRGECDVAVMGTSEAAQRAPGRGAKGKGGRDQQSIVDRSQAGVGAQIMQPSRPTWPQAVLRHTRRTGRHEGEPRPQTQAKSCGAGRRLLPSPQRAPLPLPYSHLPRTPVHRAHPLSARDRIVRTHPPVSWFFFLVLASSARCSL